MNNDELSRLILNQSEREVKEMIKIKIIYVNARDEGELPTISRVLLLYTFTSSSETRNDDFEIWSANNNPKAIAPAISVTSSIVLIALPNCNKTRFLVASKQVHQELME